MKTLLAIDPGVSGGLAWRNSTELNAVPMPDGDSALCEKLSEIVSGNDVECWIELIGTYSGGRKDGESGPSGHAVATLFGNFRFIEGWLAARHIRTRRVLPGNWQRPLGIGTRAGAGSRDKWKRKLRDEAARRFPELDVTLKTADALLILEHAGRNQ